MSVRCVSTAGQSHDNHCTILVGKGKPSEGENNSITLKLHFLSSVI